MRTKIAGIYRITSPSGKIYIGQSWSIKDRWDNHVNNDAKLGKSYISRSIRKYGKQSHLFEIIHELPLDVRQEIMDQYEVYYIGQYKSCGFHMMNIREGGSRGKLSEETKRKLSIKNSIVSDDTRSKMRASSALRVRPAHSEETRLKMSIASISRVSPKGEQTGRSKLKESQVLEIRALRGLYSPNQLAERYNVSDSLICAIQLRQCWKHI